MSCRVDTSPLIAGACIVSAFDGLGITGAAMRAATGTGGSGAGLLYNDWDSGDNAKEFRGLIVTPPSSGAFTLNEDGSFSLVGAADGAYSVVYRLFVDGADMGTAAASITVGAGTTFALTAPGLASTLAFGVAALSFSSQFAVAAAGLPSTLVFGSAVFDFQGSFAIVGAGLPSMLAFGTALFMPEGTFTPDASHPRRLVVTLDPRLESTTLPGAGGALLQPYPFSPGSRLDIEWDWRKWLNSGDALETFAIEWSGAAVGVIDHQAQGAGVVRTWLAVPDNAVDADRGVLVCSVTTSAGREDSRKYELLVKQL